MAVCSREREYVQRFAEYVNRRQASLLAVHGFTDSGELSAYTKEHPVDLLLLSEEIAAELPKKKEYGTSFSRPMSVIRTPIFGAFSIGASNV